MGEPGAAALGDYYWTQYALAPLVVEYSANHPLVVGNFPSSARGAGAGSAAEKLQLVKDFGDGVLLFSNSGANKGAN